jgi:predicted alpha/beta-hydrolase family hydrolase
VTGALLLYPGAGSDSSHPSLVAIERAVAPTACVRADFPYRREGRRAPDRALKLLAAVREELAALGDQPVVMGGRSMGGRMCSMVAAGVDGAKPANVVGLVLICYPLHPPGKRDQLRVEHLPELAMPCLFVSGTRDPFGTPAELEAHAASIPGPVTFVWVDGAGHEWKGRDRAIAEVVADWVAGRPVPERIAT